jgi:hypothetical protein
MIALPGLAGLHGAGLVAAVYNLKFILLIPPATVVSRLVLMLWTRPQTWQPVLGQSFSIAE